MTRLKMRPLRECCAIATFAGVGALTAIEGAVGAENGPETNTFHKDLCVSEETYDARIESGQYQEVLSYTVEPFTKKTVSGNPVRWMGEKFREEFVINAEGDEWAKMQPQPKEDNKYCVVYHGVEPDIVDRERDPRETLSYDYGKLDDWDNEKLAKQGVQVCEKLINNNVVTECGTHNGLMDGFYNESDKYGMAFRGVRITSGNQMLTTVNVHNNGVSIVTHSSTKGFYIGEQEYIDFGYGKRAKTALEQARQKLSMNNKGNRPD